jgi:hypothetical protein
VSATLIERLRVLRDEALDCAVEGDDAPGNFLWNAILSALEGGNDTIEQRVREEVARRLAWGDATASVLEDVDAVACRLLAAVHRAFSDIEDATRVMDITATVASSALRVVAMAGASAAQNERARIMREELSQLRLERALEGQESEIRKLSEHD